MISRLMAISLVAAIAIGAGTRPASAGGDECDGAGSIQEVGVRCYEERDGIVADIITSPSEVVWRIKPLCHYNESGENLDCSADQLCTVDGKDGVLNHVLRNEVVVATICLTPAETDELNELDPGWIRHEFRRLDWPASELTIQPPGGRTLVNLDTNFFTDDTESLVRAVTLLGLTIEVEATPTSWTWHHGDGTRQTTTTPGAPHPGLDVTHRYLRAGEVRVSLDTTYTGRFRIDGGAWHDIPETHTVTGSTQRLRVVEARPQLVGD